MFINIFEAENLLKQAGWDAYSYIDGVFSNVGEAKFFEIKYKEFVVTLDLSLVEGFKQVEIYQNVREYLSDLVCSDYGYWIELVDGVLLISPFLMLKNTLETAESLGFEGLGKHKYDYLVDAIN